jgi:hypothetical protein
MRRRLREVKREREALIIELGELSLAGHQGDVDRERFRDVAATIEGLDAEARGLAHALDSDQTLSEVVAEGVTGYCSRCHALIARHAAYCHRCGAPTGQRPRSVAAPPLAARAATSAGTAKQPAP